MTGSVGDENGTIEESALNWVLLITVRDEFKKSDAALGDSRIPVLQDRTRHLG